MNQDNSVLIRFLLLVISLLTIVGGGFFFVNRYSELQMDVNRYSTENAILQNRVQILNSSSQELAEYLNVAYNSIPETNAGLYAINTIKTIIAEDELILENVYVRTSLVQDGELQKNELNFDVTGTPDQLFAFMEKVAKSLPLVKLVELDNRVSGDSATLSIVMETYSQALPLALPSLKESLPALSEEDRLLLAELAEYTYPPLGETQTETNEEGEIGRENPFAGIDELQPEID